MNYLAHIYLSGDQDLLKIGNFIADSVRGKKYLDYPLEVQQGILLHRQIDTYTDSHEIVKQSKRKLYDNYGHYAGVIVDILYDHFLAKNWNQFSTESLTTYSTNFYELLQNNYALLPHRVQHLLPVMVRQNWLVSYATIEGISGILRGMDNRTSYRSNMSQATNELRLYYNEFEAEFFKFFEELERFCNDYRNTKKAQ